MNTDVLSILMADNAFLDVVLSAVTNTSVTIACGPAPILPDLANGPDRVAPGQLMLISKGSLNALVQVTAVNTVTRLLTFANGDSLQLNQSGAAKGTLAALNAEEPVDDASGDTHLADADDHLLHRQRHRSAHPRLVRRVNNGDPSTFDNTLGTAVAVDTIDLQFTYDISNGSGNPGGVEMNADDLTTTGACSPAACAETQIRKVNIMLHVARAGAQVFSFFENMLESQVSLRGDGVCRSLPVRDSGPRFVEE